MGTQMGLAQRLKAAQSMVTSLNTHLETGLLVHFPPSSAVKEGHGLI